MAQHFLLSTAARSLSLAKVARMSDEEAHNAFRLIRWTDTEGEPVCPRCQCNATYKYETRKLWKCKACDHQFSVTSGTIFASRKMPKQFQRCVNVCQVAPGCRCSLFIRIYDAH
jgi:transposase-like protein